MPKESPAREIESIVRLSSLINSSLDIIDVLNNSMRVVEELMDAEASSIFEVDFERNDLFFRLARGESTCGVKEIRMKMGEGIAGWVASSGEPLVVPDTKKDKRFSKKVDTVTKFKTKSIIAFPIKNRGRILGVLEVLNTRGASPFDRNHREMLTIVTNQIGIAIENARLYARLRDKFALTRSELKKAQAKLIQSERMAALGQLSQGVAHAVRNPVMSIGGFARRLKNKLSFDDSAAHYIDFILEETARLETIVEHVGEYTSLPEPDIRQVKVSKLMQSVLDVWEEKHGAEDIRIKINLMPEDPIVLVDAYLITRAVSHILLNAKEALFEGGVIFISAGWEDQWMVISVKDNGTGITAEDLPLVFDPFFSTKTDKPGLGLTTVHRIISEHKGEVKILSTPGTGTEVKIYLPPSSSDDEW